MKTKENNKTVYKAPKIVVNKKVKTNFLSPRDYDLSTLLAEKSYI